MKRFLDQTGIRDFLRNHDSLPAPGSNRGYPPAQILEALWVSIWLGANRFVHTEILRHDDVLREMFGWKRSPSHSTFGRFFRKFDLERSSNFFFDLYQWLFSQLHFDHFTLDVDSSVWTRYGNQQGAKKGYNPKKPGRNSHHPLMAFVAEMRMVANFWLRPGNTSSANNIIEFLEETVQLLAGKTISLFRADSGFYRNDVFEWLEGKAMDYVIAIRMYPSLKREIKENVKWRQLDEGIMVGEFEYQGSNWTQSRRVVVIRQHISQRPKATGKLLFPDEEVYRNYRYSAFVTSLRLSPELVWGLYRQRADAENRIKELEYDFGADSFCLEEFYATEAALRTVMMGYNLMALFRLIAMQTKQGQRLTTTRLNCFAIGSWIVKDGRNRVLKLSVKEKRRQWFEGLFSNVSNFDWLMAVP